MKMIATLALLGASLPAIAGTSQLDAYKGDYALADGHTLSIGVEQRRLVARIDGGAPSALQQLAEARFAGERGLLIEFDQRANGNVAGLRLRRPN